MGRSRGAALLALSVPALLAVSVGGSPKADRLPVTYSRDIAPIFQQYCQDCHHIGGVAPFPLLTYRDARAWAEVIQDAVQSRDMPPWPAAEGYGEFHAERRLSDDQLVTIADWVNADAPEGDPKAAPPPRQFVDGWTLGTPDVVLDAGAPFPLELNGGDVYRDFLFSYSPAKEVWVSAIEVKPSAASVVHHVSLYLDPTGASQPLERAAAPALGFPVNADGAGFSPATWLANWGPGTGPLALPAGTAWRIPARARLVMQVHYHAHAHEHRLPVPDSHPLADRTRIGLHLARGPVDKRVRTGVIQNGSFQIPAGAIRYEMGAGMAPARDISILAVTPRMRLLGREMKVTATLPGGVAQPLVWIPAWDYRWEVTYPVQQPFKLPRGARIDLLAAYDNSAHNHENPSYPPKPVGPGPRPTDEACDCFFLYTVDAEHLTRSQPVENDGIEIRQ